MWHAMHFNKVAKMLREKREDIEHPPVALKDKARTDLLNELTLEWAQFFALVNPEFDSDKFIEASGFKR